MAAGKTKVSRSKRAGLVFPVGRIGRLVKKGTALKRVSANAPVYVAAVTEYIMAEILELAVDSAKARRRNRVTTRDIRLALSNDNELSAFVGSATVPSAGVNPGIHNFLLPLKKSKA